MHDSRDQQVDTITLIYLYKWLLLSLRIGNNYIRMYENVFLGVVREHGNLDNMKMGKMGKIKRE